MERLPVTRPSRSRLIRLVKAGRNQRGRSLICPETPLLTGKLALVTGGNGGIGWETCRGLLKRGAEVVMASRNREKAARACERLRDELGAEARVEVLPLDLGDLDTVAQAVESLEGRTIDILIANAGVWPRSYSTSAQGYEQAFATNVLGHFLLIRHVLTSLSEGARVVVLTGDIYCLTRDCTPDFAYRGSWGGMLAYCRSKLGDLWLVSELHRQHPELRVCAVHPGVVASNLGRYGENEDKRGGPFIECEAGAQTSLFCATQPSLVRGGYYHNTMGQVNLDPRDPARDQAKARYLWTSCESLCRKWL